MLSFKEYFQHFLVEDNVLNMDELLNYATNTVVYDDNDELVKKWAIREIKKYIANSKTNFTPYTPKPGDPEWYSSAKNGKIFKSPEEDANFNEFLNKLRLCINLYETWSDRDKSKLLKMGFEQVYKLYLDFKNKTMVEGKDYAVVMTFNDGFKWIKLLSAFAYSKHGDNASNCVSADMFNQIKPGNNLQGVYGLYKGNKSKATLALDQDGKLLEVAFFSEKYKPYILSFLKNYKVQPSHYKGLSDKGLVGWQPYEDYLDSVGFNRNISI